MPPIISHIGLPPPCSTRNEIKMLHWPDPARTCAYPPADCLRQLQQHLPLLWVSHFAFFNPSPWIRHACANIPAASLGDGHVPEMRHYPPTRQFPPTRHFPGFPRLPVWTVPWFRVPSLPSNQPQSAPDKETGWTWASDTLEAENVAG